MARKNVAAVLVETLAAAQKRSFHLGTTRSVSKKGGAQEQHYDVSRCRPECCVKART